MAMRIPNKAKNVFRFTEDYDVKEKIILRDHLALQRTKLANERTLMSYVRSSLYLIIAGIAFLEMKDFEQMSYIGELCLLVSALILLIGIYRFWQLKKHLKEIYKLPKFGDEDADI
ncbi:MAG: DUF202 domain-containing protein [Flavobacteriaceae bacterium]|nr:DUF202 domain-containing protein [Flavobacteriaceae bacterium]